MEKKNRIWTTNIEGTTSWQSKFNHDCLKKNQHSPEDDNKT
jgi:hypothetical protein